MKKIIYAFVLLFVSTTFISCSDENDTIDKRKNVRNASGTVTLKINDEFREFGSLTVTEEIYNNYSDLVIRGTQLNDETKNIRVALGKNNLGSNSVYFVQYINNGTYFQMGSADTTSDIIESNDTTVIGTFSGTLTTINMDSLVLTEGTINLTY
jgi:hypothetical protein